MDEAAMFAVMVEAILESLKVLVVSEVCVIVAYSIFRA